MNLMRLPPPMVLRLHCSRCRAEQPFDLLTVDQERHFHQYWCRVCKRNERITTEFANDLGARQDAGTDVPPRTWGVKAALALIAKARRTNREAGAAPAPGALDSTSHRYLSTACLHGIHGHCQARTNLEGEPKTPATCKWCESLCICGCHRPPTSKGAATTNTR